MNDVDWSVTVFVAMPFGVKTVGDRDVDFNAIYSAILVPGVQAAKTPDGKTLCAARADDGFFAAVIDEPMYRYLEMSRLVLVDITGANPNVFYEMGIRHRAKASGTALVRNGAVAVPFDLSHVRVFTYDPQNTEAGRELVKKIVEESITAGEIDSPVQLVLRASANDASAADRAEILRETENALRDPLISEAEKLAALERAASRVPDADLLVKCAILANRLGRFDSAIAHANAAIQLAGPVAAAFRERGIAEGKNDSVKGEASLREAVRLDPNDFDAWASLGGILRRTDRLENALNAYNKAAKLSNNHPYPLLNAMQLKLELGMGTSEIDRIRLEAARSFREQQAAAKPPLDAPWCFFDLSDVAWFLGDADERRQMLQKGAAFATPDQLLSHCGVLEGIAERTRDKALNESLIFLKSLAKENVDGPI